VKRAALLGAILAVSSSPATAQELSLLVGGVQARYADSVSGTAGLLSVRLSGAASQAAGVIDAGFSKFANGEWVTQLSSYGTGVLGLGNGVGVGLAAGGNVDYTEGGLWSGQVSAGPLTAFTSGSFLASVGVSLGTTRNIADSAFGVSTLKARVQQELQAGLTLGVGASGVAADTVRYADLTLEFAHTGRRTKLSLIGGIRRGDLREGPWAQAHFELTVAPRATIEAAVGSYPADLAGFTDGLFATLGVRLGLTRPATRPARATPPVIVEPLESGRVRVTFSFPGPAERLEIAGDWNGWIPTPLERRGRNGWSAELALPPGIHRYSLRVDGEQWTVPEGVLTEPDDFGGEVGLLVVR
jgi:hypothetical protein